jgi:glycosyltransferase involved in cell wall biosynthesis/3-hydroxyisobutyrate dehydrogenase-like beta-hydroxyacid dehydrogenase
MRILTLSTDSNVFKEGARVARRFRLQAGAVERLDIIVPHGPGALVAIAGNSSARGFGLGKISGFSRTILAGMRIDRPDVVSVQDPFLIGLLGLIIARMRGAELNVQIHTDVFGDGFVSRSFKNRLLSILARFILWQADSIRVVSPRVQKSLESRGIKAPISVLPVYIDAEAVKRAVPLNRRSVYPQFEKIILVVSRLEPEKNVVASLRAMPEILKHVPRAGLMIVGNGSLRAPLENLARELGIEQHIVFVGEQDPFPYYKIADATLVTSDFEGYGMVAVEALLAGSPVVSFDVGIARDAGAFIVSPDTLAEKTVEVLKKNLRGRLAFSIPTENEYRDLWRAQIEGRQESRALNPDEEEAVAKLRVGFVGQGWIGKQYADEFESRGLSVVRYSLEELYVKNKHKIPQCDIVFIAVPTPTTPEGFDDHIVREAAALVGDGKVAIIKSTVIPGTTQKLQALYPKKFILHSPEFLAESTAAYDAAHPTRNIVGMPTDTPEFRERAAQVLKVLPQAPFELICLSNESELIKYTNNTVLAMKVIFINLVYDLAQRLGVDYDVVRDAVGADPRIGRSHLDPIHKSGHKDARPGRGAGGDCFIKDFEAFRRMYKEEVGDREGDALLDAIIAKNLQLLATSGKDLELLQSVYGPETLKRVLGE